MAQAGPAVWVCVPTYDEAAHVQRLIRTVLAVLRDAGVDGRLLIIDDASPDGTGELAEALRASEPRLHVLHRAGKAGIGPAYLAGFGYALARGADLVIEMDCDFSHDPGALPRLVAAAGHADVVLGSRYVAGGSIENWPLSRRLVSRAGCWYARTVLSSGIRDLTGGFKCFRRETLLELLDREVTSAGYGFQIELTHQAVLAGRSVLEIPIAFRDREAGESKMSRAIAVEAAAQVLRLRRMTRAERRAATPVRRGAEAFALAREA